MKKKKVIENEAEFDFRIGHVLVIFSFVMNCTPPKLIYIDIFALTHNFHRI